MIYFSSASSDESTFSNIVYGEWDNRLRCCTDPTNLFDKIITAVADKIIERDRRSVQSIIITYFQCNGLSDDDFTDLVYGTFGGFTPNEFSQIVSVANFLRRFWDSPNRTGGYDYSQVAPHSLVLANLNTGCAVHVNLYW